MSVIILTSVRKLNTNKSILSYWLKLIQLKKKQTLLVIEKRKVVNIAFTNCR